MKGGDALVGMHEMGHHGFQGPLPLAGSTRTRAGVGAVFTDVFMFWLLRVVQGQRTARGGILQGRKKHAELSGLLKTSTGANLSDYSPIQVLGGLNYILTPTVFP